MGGTSVQNSRTNISQNKTFFLKAKYLISLINSDGSTLTIHNYAISDFTCKINRLQKACSKLNVDSQASQEFGMYDIVYTNFLYVYTKVYMPTLYQN